MFHSSSDDGFHSQLVVLVGVLSINPVLITTKLYVCDLLLLRMFEFRQKEPHRVFVVFLIECPFQCAMSNWMHLPVGLITTREMQILLQQRLS